MEWINVRQPVTVIAGVSLQQEVAVFAPLVPTGQRQSQAATPWFLRAVEDRIVRHDLSGQVAAEAMNSRLSDLEAGPLLSARRSRGPICTLKGLVWACWGKASGSISTEAAWILT